MQRILAPVSCPNCGAALAELSNDACQVCYYPVEAPAPSRAAQPRTPSDLRAGIDDLLTRARASGLDHEAILRVLHDELAFAAELARPDRRHSVQVIDIGPRELGLREPLSSDRRASRPPRPAVTGAPLTTASSAKSL